jgi:hypothetical protein
MRRKTLRLVGIVATALLLGLGAAGEAAANNGGPDAPPAATPLNNGGPDATTT